MMRVRSGVLWIAIVGTLTSWSPRAAVCQQLTLAARTPDFFYAPSTAAKPVEIDVRRNAVLGQVVSLRLGHSTMAGLLAEIQRQTGLTFAYDPEFPASRPVTLEAESITVAAALGAILVGIGVDVVLTPTGHVWLRESELRTPRIQEGAIAGRVTDKRTDDPIIGATVTLEPGRRSVISGTDGQYRLTNLAPGSYTIRARYIGFTSVAATVAVSAEEAVTVNFSLEKAVARLEEVVTTTPGGMQTKVKVLASPVSVVTAAEIEQQRPATLNDVIRQAVPSAVGFEWPTQPGTTALSLRGAGTLEVGVGQVKIFVDGVQSATLTSNPVDPASIERIEVIRGPQASTVYGPDAAGGVIQIFTKRGDPSLKRPELTVAAEAGVQQTPYNGFGRVVRQSYSASVRGGSADASYHFGGSYWHLPNWLPNGQPSNESAPSVFGGLHAGHGILSADLSARYYVTNNYSSVLSPLVLQSGFVPFSRPNPVTQKFTNQTVGAQLGLVPTSWWQNRLTVGFDQQALDLAQLRPKLTTPADTLLRVAMTTQSRVFGSYNTSVQWAPIHTLSGSLTAGIDYYRLPATLISTTRALNTDGTLALAPGGTFGVTRVITTNTGYFAQLEVGLQERLFLTTGLRADRNSSLGQDYGTAVSPRVGLAYTHELGGVTLKARGSWGRAIRAPAPTARSSFVSASSITLANPLLAPERQRGWDGGLDVAFGTRGSLSLTGYDQTAEDLLLYVQVTTQPVPTYQYQNVGRVKNRGIEVEATWNLRNQLQLSAQYAYVESRIKDLGPNFTGDERMGDAPRGVPAHTAGGTLTLWPWRGMVFTGGMTYVGSFREYDWLALYSCFGGTGSCRPTNRDYIVDYPGFVKINATMSQQLAPQLTGFVSVKNLTNNHAHEGGGNVYPVWGRLTSVGVQLRY